jgi:N4-gp56 family major capsid protein
MANAITGTGNLSGSPTAYPGTNTQLTQSIQTIWSKEILFQAMPILRMEQFAVKKTELGVAPGLTINFMRYQNLDNASALVEGVRMETHALTAEQFSITVTEHGYAVAVSELLLNASFDDVMASASRLLGRQMAVYLDTQCRDTLYTATSKVFGYASAATRTAISPYDKGTAGSGTTIATQAGGGTTPFGFTRTRAARSATPRSSSRSRSTRPPATSCSVRSVVSTTVCSSRPRRSRRT